MTKGQMKEVLEKTETLEKILMRDLEESEINYLVDHSVNDFLYDILGFNKEDLLVLRKIKKSISDWCTRPDSEVNSINESANLFFENPEFEDEEVDLNFFEETTNRVNRKVSGILSNILSDLEKEKKDFVAKTDDKDKIEIKSCSEKPKEFEFDENDEVPDECGNPISEDKIVSIENLIPDCAKKWIVNLTQREIINAVDKAIEILTEDYIKRQETSLEFKGLKSLNFDEDEIASEIVDQIKDVAINHYVAIIQQEGEYEFSDTEIQSEVLDYLYKHNYKVKSINNKVSLV